jgi:hypothetical protein
VNTGSVVVGGTGSTNEWLPGTTVPEPLQEYVDQGNAIVEGTNVSVASVAAANATANTTGNTAGNANRPRPLKNLVNQVKDAVNQATAAINKALGIDKPAAGTSQSPTGNQPDSGNSPGADGSDSGG